MKVQRKLRKRTKPKLLKPEAPKHIKEPSQTPKIKKGRVPAVFEPKFLNNCDGRNTLIRILKEKTELLKQQTNANSLAKTILCDRAIFLSCVLETIEVHALEKGVFDSGSYTQSCNALTGLLKTLGLEKHKIKTALSDYVSKFDDKENKSA